MKTAKVRKSKIRKLLSICTWLLAICFFCAILLLNGLGFYLGNIVYTEINIGFAQTHHTVNQAKEARLRQGIKQENWQDIEIDSPQGYVLHGTFIPQGQSKRTIVFLHGFTQNRTAGLDYLPMYQELDFNVLLVDLRAHGDSGGQSVTWGVKEKRDVDAWLDWLAERVPGGVVGIHGISMGAATALLHGAMHEAEPRVEFYIADSAYSELKPLLREEIKKRLALPDNTIVPDILLGYGDIVCWVKERFTFEESAPAEAAKHIPVPVLYIHGEEDRLVPVAMAKKLYDITLGDKEIALFPQATHAMAFYKNSDAYEYKVGRFIKKALVKHTGVD